MAKTSRRRPEQRWGTIRLVLTDNAGIRALHLRWMNSATVTDVLSQRYQPIPGENAADAELIVNVQRATEAGPLHWKRFKQTARAECHELALYVAHGCDHLSGATDSTGGQRQRMRRRELRWLRDSAAMGLLDGIFKAQQGGRAAVTSREKQP